MDLRKRGHFIQLHISKIGLINTVSYFIQRVFIRKGKLIVLKLKNLESKLYLRNKTYDTNIFYQIFIAEELEIKIGGHISSILDLGGNIGLSTLYLLRMFPNAKILVVEPEEMNYKILKKNTSQYPNVKRLKTAVYGYETDLYLVDVGEGEASYQLREDPGKYKILNSIKCLGLNSIIEKYFGLKVDLVKMDIEGSEKSCMKFNNNAWLARTRTLLVEIHEVMHPGLTQEIKNELAGNFSYSVQGEYNIFKSKIIRD